MSCASAIILSLITAFTLAEPIDPAASTHAAATINHKEQKLTQQPSRTRPDLDPVYDPAYKGTTYSGLGGPFLIQVSDSFFRKTEKYPGYPGRETMANHMFLFVGIDIFNNSGRPLQIPVFTLQDSQGRTYVGAARARLFSKIIRGGEVLNPGVGRNGYLVFDVPWVSGVDPLPMRYKLLPANSRHIIDLSVYRMKE